MSINLSADFSVDKENKTITVKREFAATISLVWDAYTKSEILDQWWAPKPWKAKTKTMDFKEGGHWFYAMVGPDGEEHWSLVKFTSVQPQLASGQKKYTGNDAFTDTEGNVNKDFPQSNWEVTFYDKGEVTLVEYKLFFEDLVQLEKIIQMGFKEGLSIAMEGLDALLPSLKK